MNDADAADLAVTAGKVALLLTLVGGFALVASLIVDPPAPTGDAPSASLTIERINQTHVRVTHDGGDPIPAEQLLVTVDGRARPLARTAPLREGGTVVIPAREDALVEVYWAGEERTPKLLERTRV